VKGGFDPAALEAIVPLPFLKLLYRGVRLNTLLSRTPPQPLFASSSENRYNLHGTKTLYFGENILTAYAETVQKNAGLLIEQPTQEHKTPAGYDVGEKDEEPIVVFVTKAILQKVIDLADPGIRSKLSITEDSLLGPWRWQASHGNRPLTQLLGDAAFLGGWFEAIRYPSHKAQDPSRAVPHANLVVFVDRLEAGSFLEVSDVSGRLQGRLP
jgi:RES domain-containing protein